LKLHCWNLTQFDRVVYVDADSIALRNVEHLFRELRLGPDMIAQVAANGMETQDGVVSSGPRPVVLCFPCHTTACWLGQAFLSFNQAILHFVACYGVSLLLDVSIGGRSGLHSAVQPPCSACQL
jgi:hypothetical protein